MYAKREALIKRRNQLGLSRKDMAKQLGIPCGTYVDIEKGLYNPSIDSCSRISKMLGIDALVFMSRINRDLDIYDKNEPLKVVQIFFSHGGGRDCINILRVEDSQGTRKDLTLDEFSNVLYYRYIREYSLNIDYQAHGSKEADRANKRQALIEKRNQLGYTQEYIAGLIGTTSVTYRRIESGISSPCIKLYTELSRVLGVNVFVLLNRINKDLNIYDKNEQLKLLWIFVNDGGGIDMLRVEDSQGTRKDLTLDEFSNVLYYRYINKYSLNITYKAHGSEELRLEYIKDKSQSLLNWCLENGEFGQYIINNAQLPQLII